jgi:AcrR family transcriptional regulator
VQTQPGAFMPPAPPKTPKAAETRRRLLALAAQLFIERGYNAVSMQDIALAASLTKGAVYGHFRSKGQLLVEVIRSKIAERETDPDFVAATSELGRGVGMMFDEAGRDTRVLEVDAAAAARHDPDVAAGLAALYLERQAQVRERMLTAADPDTAAWLVAAITTGIGMKEAAGLSLPAEDRLRATILAALRGL